MFGPPVEIATLICEWSDNESKRALTKTSHFWRSVSLPMIWEKATDFGLYTSPEWLQDEVFGYIKKFAISKRVDMQQIAPNGLPNLRTLGIFGLPEYSQSQGREFVERLFMNKLETLLVTVFGLTNDVQRQIVKHSPNISELQVKPCREYPTFILTENLSNLTSLRLFNVCPSAASDVADDSAREIMAAVTRPKLQALSIRMGFMGYGSDHEVGRDSVSVLGRAIIKLSADQYSKTIKHFSIHWPNASEILRLIAHMGSLESLEFRVDEPITKNNLRALFANGSRLKRVELEVESFVLSGTQFREVFSLIPKLEEILIEQNPNFLEEADDNVFNDPELWIALGCCCRNLQRIQIGGWSSLCTGVRFNKQLNILKPLFPKVIQVGTGSFDNPVSLNYATSNCYFEFMRDHFPSIAVDPADSCMCIWCGAMR